MPTAKEREAGMVEFTVVATGEARQLSESPVWRPLTRRLWWVDVAHARLHSLDPSSGAREAIDLPGKAAGCCVPRASGGLAVALDGALHGFDPESGALTRLVSPESDRPLNRLNDGKADRRGRLWIGTMNAEVFEPDGALYRIAPDLRVEKQFGDVIIPNAIAFSPDDRTFYFADTRRLAIWAFDFDIAEGRIANRRVFADTSGHPGRPDGATVDAEGFLWSAEIMGGRLVRYAPDGRIDRVVPVPVPRPTSCAFGGEGLETLFVTSMSIGLDEAALAEAPGSGGLIAFRPGVRGLPEPAFAG
jgi:sugar lactone lactonase YvrE